MSKIKGNTIKTLNCGAMIRAIMKKQHLNNTDVARKINRHHSTIKTLVQNSSLQTYLIWEFSVALKHNFFNDLARQLDQSVGEGVLENSTEPLGKRVEELEKEIQQLKEEREYLRKAMDALARK